MLNTLKPVNPAKTVSILLSLISILTICSRTAAIDKTKYITTDEIKPGSQAYCLSVISGTKVERFDLEVLSVIRNHRPGRDAILVLGIDEIFKHTGAIRGCSGSPVYIDNRLAGALAASWTYTKDPLYIVTPIEDMLKVGRYQPDTKDQSQPSISIDLSKTPDFDQIQKDIINACSQNRLPGAEQPCLLATSLPQQVCTSLAEQLKPAGLLPIPAGQIASSTQDTADVPLEPGASLAIPLVSGDMLLSAAGTVTEVIDNKVYAFGHNFLGHGPVDLPMANAYVHTVVASISSSFKLVSVGKTVGAIQADEATGVYGRSDLTAPTIPIRITIDRYNDSQKKVYNCNLIVDRLYTPLMIQTAIAGAAGLRGPLPPKHMIQYKGRITCEGLTPIIFENISSQKSYGDCIPEAAGAVAMLINNPFQKVKVLALEFELKIIPEDIVANIWSIDLSKSIVKPGETVDISVTLLSQMSKKTVHSLKFAVPNEVKPGTYNLTITGGPEYENFITKASPHKLTAYDLPTMVDALNNALTIRRDKLHAIMTLPPGGITVQQIELPDLPQTKVLLLKNPKRTMMTLPYQHWIQESVKIDSIVAGKKTMKVTVEK